MPTEAELREQFHGDDHPGGEIDLDAVLRRSRARRRPRLIAIAAVSMLAVVGIVVPVTIGVAAGRTSTSVLSAGSAASSGSDHSAAGDKAPESAAGGGTSIDRAPADKVNLCTGTLAEVSPAQNGLLLTVQPVDAAAASRDIPVSVTLTNTGTQHLLGSTLASPAITFSRDGIVLWHSNGPVPMIALSVDLAPGASLTYSATFQPQICAVVDDEGPGFRDGLPPAGPGSYRLSAAIDFTPSDGSATVLVTGPTATATLR